MAIMRVGWGGGLRCVGGWRGRLVDFRDHRYDFAVFVGFKIVVHVWSEHAVDSLTGQRRISPFFQEEDVVQ
jgi:hypothetical protein